MSLRKRRPTCAKPAAAPACFPSTRAEPRIHTAETAYLFRHALLRDAAYQLQLPGDRARLHGFALAVIEDLCGGPPPDPGPLDAASPPRRPHPADPWALELADHAEAALSLASDAAPAGMAAAFARYMRLAATVARDTYRFEAAKSSCLRLAARLDGPARARAVHEAAGAAHAASRPSEAEDLYGQAIDRARAVPHPEFTADALLGLALVFRETGRTGQALKLAEEALSLHRAAGVRRGERLVLTHIATILNHLGRVAEAEDAHLQALALHRAAGDRASEGLELGNLGSLPGDRPGGAGREAQRGSAGHPP